MKPCRRILCAIDPTAQGEQILRQALSYARQQDATLVTAHVVDYHCGYESDYAPCLSPSQLTTEMARFAEQALRAMLQRRYPEGRLQVVIGPARKMLLELAAAEQVDLVMLSNSNPFGLRTGQASLGFRALPFEVLTLHIQRDWRGWLLWGSQAGFYP